MSEMPIMAWTEANQALLVAEFTRLKARLSGADEAPAEALRSTAYGHLPEPAAIDVVTERFGLSSFERDVLLLCAAVEMDAEVGPLCAAAASISSRSSAPSTASLTMNAASSSRGT